MKRIGKINIEITITKITTRMLISFHFPMMNLRQCRNISRAFFDGFSLQSCRFWNFSSKYKNDYGRDYTDCKHYTPRNVASAHVKKQIAYYKRDCRANPPCKTIAGKEFPLDFFGVNSDIIVAPIA